MKRTQLIKRAPAAVLLALAAALLACSTKQNSVTPAKTAVDTSTATAVGTEMDIVVETTTAEPEKGNADVTFVRAAQAAAGTWSFHVTVRHPDTGWEDYADGWDVVTPNGQVLKSDPDGEFTRVLLHPHVDEQPFTRSQSGITIPEGVTQVRVRAHDLVDGFGGQEVIVDLEAESGEHFEVERQG